MDPHVARVNAISSWLQRFDIGDPASRAEISIDIADCLHAARRVETLVDQLISHNLADLGEAVEALADSCEIEVLLFEEMTPHLDGLHRTWGQIVSTHIATLLPPDEEDTGGDDRNAASKPNPYEKWEGSELWSTLAQGLRELTRNGDLTVTTNLDYVVGVLCKHLDEAGLRLPERE